MKIRLGRAVPVGLLTVATIAAFAVYGTHTFTILGRIGGTVF
ncbi:hypothetical protein [Streptomyces sp. NPDC006997]